MMLYRQVLKHLDLIEVLLYKEVCLFPITTPAHGTAFDIAGKNKANLEPTLNSFKIALTMAENRNK